MSSDENKALLRRYYDALNAGRLPDTLEEYVAPEVVAWSATPGRKGQVGLEEWRRTLVHALAAMPDQRLVLVHLVADGDLVVAHGRRIAHWHPGDFRGTPLAGTDLPLDTAFVHICRVADGLIREMWSLRDELDMAVQLGLGLAQPG